MLRIGGVMIAGRRRKDDLKSFPEWVRETKLRKFPLIPPDEREKLREEYNRVYLLANNPDLRPSRPTRARKPLTEEQVIARKEKKENKADLRNVLINGKIKFPLYYGKVPIGKEKDGTPIFKPYTQRSVDAISKATLVTWLMGCLGPQELSRRYKRHVDDRLRKYEESGLSKLRGATFISKPRRGKRRGDIPEIGEEGEVIAEEAEEGEFLEDVAPPSPQPMIEEEEIFEEEIPPPPPPPRRKTVPPPRLTAEALASLPSDVPRRQSSSTKGIRISAPKKKAPKKEPSGQGRLRGYY